jgi:hypothetical protein
MLSHPTRLSACLSQCKIGHLMDVQRPSLLHPLSVALPIVGQTNAYSSLTRRTQLYPNTLLCFLQQVLPPPSHSNEHKQNQQTKARTKQQLTQRSLPPSLSLSLSQRQPYSSQKRGCAMANKRQMTFETNENVLCFHGPLLYEAKVTTFS